MAHIDSASNDTTSYIPVSMGLRWVRFISIATIIISFIALVRLVPVDQLVGMLSTYVEQLGVWGPVLFGVAYILAAVLFVPGSALTLAAGAVFGLGWGSVTVSLASTTAAALAFLIGRYIARESVRRLATRSPKFGAIDGAIGKGGWKIIALLRLSPAVPFSLGNYLFGLTAIRFWPYVVTSWIAMMPGTFMYVYLGYAGRVGLGAAASESSGRTPGEWALLGIGLVATVAVTVYVTRIAREAIKEQTSMESEAEASQVETESSAPRHGRSSRVGAALLGGFALILAGCTACAYMNRSLVAGLFGPPAVTLGETYADKPDGATFDHSIFNKLLKTHVDDGGRVDYKALKDDAKLLDTYIAALAKAPVDKMGRDERLALLINGYNAFTLRLILDHYPITSIKDIATDKRWDAKRWDIGGKQLSLNDIEHKEIRPNFKEVRIHFALVCAAVGCPPLRDEAYVADRLETQLHAQAEYVHTHERWFQYEPSGQVIKLTSLYDWYGGDFKQVAGSVLTYAAGYSEPLKEALNADRVPKIEFLEYDWSLNAKRR